MNELIQEQAVNTDSYCTPLRRSQAKVWPTNGQNAALVILQNTTPAQTRPGKNSTGKRIMILKPCSAMLGVGQSTPADKQSNKKAARRQLE